jgi:3-hydroxyisobutyrate dehydrogenase-like beta-hydroxyacid dehydrogenase
MSLADKSELKQEDLLRVLSLGAMANPLFALKGPAMQKGSFPPAFPLKHQQKDMRLALELGCVADEAGRLSLSVCGACVPVFVKVAKS